jgi:hypothetical protein
VRTGAIIALVSVLFGLIWLVAHPALPQLPNGDVFTSLGVARHLAAGDGLLNDTVYPLFTAYDWGRTMPQPLIHRPPGLAILLLPAWWLSGGDPAGAEALVQPVMVAVMVVMALVGLLGLRRQGHLAGSGAWLLLLIVNPLMALGVNWGWGEIPTALLLLVLWRMLRNRRPAAFSFGRTALFAAVCGLMAMVRSDLLWVPVLWWVLAALADRREQLGPAIRRTLVAAVVGVIVIAPWYAHVTRHAGAPLANPLVEAVQLDLSEEWYDYPLLRGRTPIPLADNLQQKPQAALLKTAVGVRVYLRTLGLWLPWLFWLVCTALWIERTRSRRRQGEPWLRAIGPPGHLALTVVLMVLQYSFFSHETRHLLPVLPVLAWEGVILADRRLGRLVPGAWRRGALLALLAWFALRVTPPGLGGEGGNVATARELSGLVDRVTVRAAELPPGPVFTDNAVVPWRLGRPCVWSPYDATIEAEIRTAVPAMADAPWIRLTDQ